MAKDTERGARESSLASGWTVEGSDAPEPAAPAPPAADPAPLTAGAESSEQPEEAGRPQLSNASLVVLGVLGGLYLVYTWIWFSWAQFYAGAASEQLAATSGSMGSALQLALYWIAPLAPVLWFVSVLLLNRGAATWKLGVWLLVGAVVLMPLPYLFWSV